MGSEFCELGSELAETYLVCAGRAPNQGRHPCRPLPPRLALSHVGAPDPVPSQPGGLARLGPPCPKPGWVCGLWVPQYRSQGEDRTHALGHLAWAGGPSCLRGFPPPPGAGCRQASH